MCGRFTQAYSWEEVHDFLNLFGPAQNLEPHYNLAPTQRAAVVRLDAKGRRVLSMLRWGLIPSWSKDEKIASRLINARAETVASMPAFRSAFNAKRCLIPVSGFYEWTGPPKQRQPYHIVKTAQPVYCLAGLWETWRPKDQTGAETVETFTIITTEAVAPVRVLHTRMPVIIAPEDFGRWLTVDTPAPELQTILAHPDAERLRAYPVSPRVNSVRHDGRALIEERVEATSR
jgi:putative SOS response-associated peptidase YedK